MHLIQNPKSKIQNPKLLRLILRTQYREKSIPNFRAFAPQLSRSLSLRRRTLHEIQRNDLSGIGTHSQSRINTES
jgi:hypothetical protein